MFAWWHIGGRIGQIITSFSCRDFARAKKKTTRGRPKQDVLKTAKQVVSDFRAASAGEGYFGKANSHRRLMDRTLKALDQVELSEEVATEGKVILKQLRAATDVLKAWMRRGAMDKDVFAEFKRSVHYAKLSPESPLPFPRLLAGCCSGVSIRGRFSGA